MMTKHRNMGLLSLAAVALCGLTLLSASEARADTCNGFTKNLLTNCGFESGNFSSWVGSAVTIGSNYAGVDNGDPFTAFPTPYQGQYEAYLGYPGSTISLTQSVATTVGGTYFVQFALLNDTAVSTGYTNSLLATFGTGAYSLSALNVGPYTLYGFSAIATSSFTPLSLATRNDGGFFELASVSVIQTPEPGTLTLLGSGVLGLAGSTLRRSRRRLS